MAETRASKSVAQDARGRSVRMLDPVTLHVLHRYDTIDAGTLHEIVEDLEPGTARFRRYVIIIVPSSILLVALGIATLYYFSDAAARADLVSTLKNPVIVVPNIVCCFIVPWIVARQARMKRVRSVMLRHRRCPHCGYDLRGSPADPNDAMTTCPECGCAWLLSEGVINNEAAATQQSIQAQHKKVILAVAAGLTLAVVLGLVAFMKML